MHLSIEKITAWLVIVNMLTVLAYIYDKRAAMNGNWRVPEKTLFLLALLGGTPAALITAKIIRHKNRKVSFRLKMRLIVGLQIIATGYFSTQ